MPKKASVIASNSPDTSIRSGEGNASSAAWTSSVNEPMEKKTHERSSAGMRPERSVDSVSARSEIARARFAVVVSARIAAR